MASPTDPNFGADFDADAFRNAITGAMEMGLPADPSERVTFRWKTDHTYATADPAGNPYNFTATPVTTTAKADVQIPAAVEFISGRSAGMEGTVFGAIEDRPLAIITVLDTHYPLVQGADQVLLGGDTYNIDYVAPPIGLFTVTVYQLHCRSLSET